MDQMFKNLFEAPLSRGNEFLYIVIAEAPDQEVFF
jgi:hypothetical protein